MTTRTKPESHNAKILPLAAYGPAQRQTKLHSGDSENIGAVTVIRAGPKAENSEFDVEAHALRIAAALSDL